MTAKDPLSALERSARMALVRSRGNRSTELVVEKALRAARISGWRKHDDKVAGTPDFYFWRERLAVFVHGCFWHGCERCGRRIPFSRRAFWSAKLMQNRRRDARTRRQLSRNGVRTMRVWEHELRNLAWLDRLKRRLTAAQAAQQESH